MSLLNHNLSKKFIIVSLAVALLIIISGILFLLNFNRINKKPEAIKPPPIQQQKPVSAYQPQIAKLDALVASVSALPKSFDPDIKEEMFKDTKWEIENVAKKAKEALAKGDVTEASRQLTKTNLKGWIIALGDPLQSKFVPPEIKAKVDPQDLVIKKDRVDPRIMDYYLKTVEIYLSVMK